MTNGASTKKSLYLEKLRIAQESLPLWKRFILRFWGCVYVGKDRYPGWSEKSDFYLFFCKRCRKIHYDYLHGHAGRLDCPVY